MCIVHGNDFAIGANHFVGSGLEQCVLKIFREMKFHPDDNDADITYPLVFQSE